MTQKQFNELRESYCIASSEVENVFDFVSELLHLRAKELEEKEPYAVKTINVLENAAYEAWDLINYIGELEENN